MNVLTLNFIKKTSLAISLLAFSSFAFGISHAQSAESSDLITYQAPKKNKKLLHFTSGTGFFVNNSYIVTNEHVVQSCKSIKVRGAVPSSSAKLVAIDKVSDLALIKTSQGPERVAMLRGPKQPIKEGEDVVVMGYPLERGIRGQYVVKNAKITDANDVYDGVSRIQFTDSVEKGNSGGPLMDDNGNVIGVIVGKMSFYLADASTAEGIEAKPVKTSSIAINLESLRSFLNTHNVYYKEDIQTYDHPNRWLEQKAKKYIVNIHCIKD